MDSVVERRMASDFVASGVRCRLGMMSVPQLDARVMVRGIVRWLEWSVGRPAVKHIVRHDATPVLCVGKIYSALLAGRVTPL